MDIKTKIERHNKNINEQFKRAEKRERICLTDMLISKEQILMEMYKNEV